MQGQRYLLGSVGLRNDECVCVYTCKTTIRKTTQNYTGSSWVCRTLVSLTETVARQPSGSEGSDLFKHTVVNKRLMGKNVGYEVVAGT